jgi:hypothetical protein
MAIGVSKLTPGGAQRYVNVGAVGTLNGTSGTQVGASLKFYKIQVQDNSNSNIDLQSEDDADNELFEIIIRQLPQGLLAYDSASASTGLIYAICDGVNAPAAADIQAAIRALGSSVGANSVDVRGTDVTDGTHFVVS